MDRKPGWRRIVFVVVALGILGLLFHRARTAATAGPVFPTSNKGKQQQPLSAPESLIERFEQDPDNVDGLTTQQCNEFFPDLYYDIDRAVAYWQEKEHTISADDVEVSWRKWDGEPMGTGSGGALRILIHENEMRILESEGTIGHWGYRGRGMGFLYLMQRAIDSAIAAGETLPTVEAAIMLEDIVDPPNGTDGTHSFWTWTSHLGDVTHERHWLIPNYDLWYAHPMGSFPEAKRRAMGRDKPFKDKIQKVVWRGSGFLNPGIREKLVEVSKDKDWADIVIANMGGLDSDKYLTVEDMCKYAITVHTEGVSYSGRLSYLLNCDSLKIIHDLEWSTFTTHLLQHEGPNQNYVKVQRDWEDLEEEVEHYLDNPDEAQMIIEESIATFRKRYLSRPAVSCYLRRLVQEYSTVSFTPKVYRPRKKGRVGEYRRGIAFHRFLDKPEDKHFEDDEWF